MIIQPKAIKPIYTQILTTAYRYPVDMETGGVIDVQRKKGDMSCYQKIVEIGNMVHSVKKDDWIQVNPMRYAQFKHQKGSLKDGVIQDNPIIGFHFPVVNINGEEYMLLDEKDIDFIITDFDEVKFSNGLVDIPTLI